MKIAMANDHAGTRLKNKIKAYLEEEGYEVVDFGIIRSKYGKKLTKVHELI